MRRHSHVVLCAADSDPEDCLLAIEIPMSKAKKLAIGLALTLAVCIPLAIWLYRQVLIDKCLDAGGAWDYQQRHCVYEGPSPPGSKP